MGMVVNEHLHMNFKFDHKFFLRLPYIDFALLYF